MKRYISYIIIALLLIGCRDEERFVEEVVDGPDLAGEMISFTTGLRSVKGNTRTLYTGSQADMKADLNATFTPLTNTYNGIDYLYEFDVTMYEQGETNSVGSAKYRLAVDGTDYDQKGTLELAYGETPLFWPDNSNKYGFEVVSNETALTADQSTTKLFLDNDYLKGYAFEPEWDSENSHSSDDIDALNYRTSRGWYAANKENKPQWAENINWTEDDYRKVPLYLKHQRSWVTIILKAGKGVPRQLLTYAATSTGFTSKIFSYGTSTPLEINPWRKEETGIHYDKDQNGPQTNEGESISLNAIVEPHNYLDDMDKPILEFVLNNSKYEYKPNNDGNYSIYHNGEPVVPVEPNKSDYYTEISKEEYDKLDDDKKSEYDNAKNKYDNDLIKYNADKSSYDTDLANYQAARAAMDAYNLTAGKHLTITATLTTDRIVLITAQLEDWETIQMSSVCDDFGQAGNPTVIDTKEKLLAFLANENLPGSIGLISAPTLDLDEGGAWVPCELNCMLNLAGATLKTKGKVFTTLSTDASLLNGTIEINGNGSFSASVCDTNKGNLEQITVAVAEGSTAYATKGGLVAVNHGTIFECVNNLPVVGSSGNTENPVYIGGIAGESKKADDMTSAPVIDKCVVNAKVSASDETAVTGVGGIAGYAENRLSRCTFNYGMTLTQQTNTDKLYANIVHSTLTNPTTPDQQLLVVDAYGNYWPTKVNNEIGRNSTKNANTNTFAQNMYDAVIDCESELGELLKLSHSSGSRYRIADDFEVSASWNYGIDDNEIGDTEKDAQKYNLNFELDGNGKKITTNGKRLFSHINGYFHDMTIYCAESIESEPHAQGTDMASAFAFAVNKNDGVGVATIERIKVKMAPGTAIVSSQPAGIICRAYGGALVKDCEVKAVLTVKFLDTLENQDSRHYAGGIAACSTDATFSGCKVHSGTVISQDGREGLSRTFHYRGGIVGGILFESGSQPKTVIEECYSWWDYRPLNAGDSPAGALIGAATYSTEGSNENKLGISAGEDKVFGNWWMDVVKAAGDKSDQDVIETIGRRNSVVPTEETNF